MVVLTEHSPGSSSFSSTHDHRYDVFLSFRGVDTRKRFTAHLYKALREADFNTFLDDEEIETGEQLKPELESAIKASRASIIVLSENYASSTWCLDELVLILEQKSTFNQIVIPVFYDVEPTNVRKQQSSFGKSMEKHKQKMEAETDAEKRSEWCQKMELWKRALTQVAGLKGKDADGRMETELIEEIVNDIYNRLGVPLGHTTLPQLIGMKDHVKRITSWLKDESSQTAGILAIWGMGGIGKTSLADYVYKLHHREYTGSFVGDISRRCAGKYPGLLDVQKQLCDDISKKSLIQVHDVSVCTSKIENALARKKVLLVLDDVDSLDQLDALLGNKGLHSGSKIIITTKDGSLIERCALFKTKVKPIYTECRLKGLSVDASMELLCLHAFTCNYPDEGYEEVSEKLARYCEGHPLALKILGKSLHDRDVREWEDSIVLLKKELHPHIKNVLQMSFDSLPFENDKGLLKHIACFFVGIDRDLTETILNACDINTRSGIMNLIDKCLLSITRDKKLMMHSLIQEMGRDLVRQESLDKPWERSRLFCHDESFKVLELKKGTENVFGLALDTRMLEKEKLCGSLQLKTDALSKMDSLKLLQLNYVNINGSYKNISKELRWLCMHGFRFKSIPPELPMENLVVLDMSHSKIESFDMSYSVSQRFVSTVKGLIGSSSNDKKLLGSLKILDLSFCEQLHRVGGFLELPALEQLIVIGCISLIEVCESVNQCVELVHVDLRLCYKLRKIPISKLKKVQTLFLDGCNFGEFQIGTWDISYLPSILTSLFTITHAIPSDHKFFMNSLPSSLRILSLKHNNLSNESFPRDFSCLTMLEELFLDDNPLVSMPSCLRSLPRLQTLSIAGCMTLMSIERPPPTLRKLLISTYKNNYQISPREIKFDPEMSPLDLKIIRFSLAHRGADMFEIQSHLSTEIDGMLKIHAMKGVEEKVLHSLGWTNLEFIREMHFGASNNSTSYESTPTQMYYEFGIFSTIYEGKEMPDWIRCKSHGPSISFTIPTFPKRLRGENFLSLLSHWMFGPNEMEAGDHITVTIEQKRTFRIDERQVTRECGIGLVYEDDDGTTEVEEVLHCYKSWNHIIGGDLSAFQAATGEYLLQHDRFMPRKENQVGFKAFSQKKSRRPSHVFFEAE